MVVAYAHSANVEEAMRKILFALAGVFALSVTGNAAHAWSERATTGAAIGAGTGAVIAGPVGAVVGGAVGAVVGGPRITKKHCWYKRGQRYCKRY
jgi:hypothetical protein